VQAVPSRLERLAAADRNRVARRIWRIVRCLRRRSLQYLCLYNE
jgi:hypothetical protein